MSRTTTPRLEANGEHWRVTWFEHGPDGKVRRRQTLGLEPGASKRKAEKAYRDFLRCWDEQVAGDDDGPGIGGRRRYTLGEWWDRYSDLRRDELAGKVLDDHGRTLEWMRRVWGERKRLDTVTAEDAADLAAALRRHTYTRTPKGKPRPLSAQRVSGHLRNAHTIMGKAVELGVLDANPFSRVKRSAPTPARPGRPLTDDEVRRYVDAALNRERGHEWRRWLALCAYAGMRQAEAARARWEDVDWERGCIMVRARKGEKVGKGIRYARLEQVLRDILEPEKGAPSRLIVGISTRAVHVTAKKIQRDAGLDFAKPFHALRAWRATTWRRLYPANVVNEWMGHTEETARGHYLDVEAHDYQGPVEQIAARLDMLDDQQKQAILSLLTGAA